MKIKTYSQATFWIFPLTIPLTRGITSFLRISKQAGIDLERNSSSQVVSENYTTIGIVSKTPQIERPRLVSWNGSPRKDTKYTHHLAHYMSSCRIGTGLSNVLELFRRFLGAWNTVPIEPTLHMFCMTWLPCKDINCEWEAEGWQPHSRIKKGH